MKMLIVLTVSNYCTEGYTIRLEPESDRKWVEDTSSSKIIGETEVNLTPHHTWMVERSEVIAADMKEAADRKRTKELNEAAEFRSKFLMLTAPVNQEFDSLITDDEPDEPDYSDATHLDDKGVPF